jgi:hypothetical protein
MSFKANKKDPTRRPDIMGKRDDAHRDHAEQTSVSLMRHLRTKYRLDTGMSQRSNTEAKSMGLSHQGCRGIERRALRITNKGLYA